MLRSIEHLDHSNFLVSNRTIDPRDWQVRCVCGEVCNNGWMRRLEDKAESVLTPLIKGLPLRLTPEHQKTVASWSAMKAIVAEYEDPDMASVHHTHRKMMLNKQIVPADSWAIWIGYFPRKVWVSTYTSTPFLCLSDEKLAKRSHARATYYNGSITTQAIGELLIHVVHGPKPFGLGKWQYPIFPDGGTLRQIWPPNKYSILWPPAPMSERDRVILTRTLKDRIARTARDRLLVEKG